MALSLNTSFLSVKKVLEAHLKCNNMRFSNYSDRSVALNCTINAWNINDVGKGVDGDNSANVTVSITYTAVIATIATAKPTVETATKQMTLNILSTINDNKWGPIMKARVWKNDYPSAVGIEEVTGNVYLVYLREYGIEFSYFAKLSDGELMILETLHTDAPYEIKVDADVLFQCLEGDVGNNELRKNVIIVLNCLPPIQIKFDNKDEINQVVKQIVED